MFSSKTTSLLGCLSRSSAIGRACLYINCLRDTRTETAWSTHDPLLAGPAGPESKIVCVKLDTLANLTLARFPADAASHPYGAYADFDVVGIDEAQFFPDLFPAVQCMVEELGLLVYVAGLDGDYKREGFPNVVSLIPLADTFKKLRARCARCGRRGETRKAPFTCRLTAEKSKVVVGGSETYQAVCRSCFVAPRPAGAECPPATFVPAEWSSIELDGWTDDEFYKGDPAQTATNRRLLRPDESQGLDAGAEEPEVQGQPDIEAPASLSKQARFEAAFQEFLVRLPGLGKREKGGEMNSIRVVVSQKNPDHPGLFWVSDMSARGGTQHGPYLVRKLTDGTHRTLFEEQVDLEGVRKWVRFVYEPKSMQLLEGTREVQSVAF